MRYLHASKQRTDNIFRGLEHKTKRRARIYENIFDRYTDKKIYKYIYTYLFTYILYVHQQHHPCEYHKLFRNLFSKCERFGGALVPHVGNMPPAAARNESDRIIGTSGWFQSKVHDIFKQRGDIKPWVVNV